LKLITWQVIDTIRRLDDISAGTVGRTAVTTLGWDHIVTAIQDDQDDLKVIAWGDFSVGMLHGTWKPTGGTSSAPAGRLLRRPESDEEEEREGREAAAAKRENNDPAADVLAAGPNLGGSVESPLPAGQSPAPSLVFFPEITGVDAQIAVGQDYVIVTQDHYVEFLYKKGTHAGEKLAGKNGENLTMSATS